MSGTCFFRFSSSFSGSRVAGGNAPPKKAFNGAVDFTSSALFRLLKGWRLKSRQGPVSPVAAAAL
jgi:hypothetical protein